MTLMVCDPERMRGIGDIFEFFASRVLQRVDSSLNQAEVILPGCELERLWTLMFVGAQLKQLFDTLFVTDERLKWEIKLASSK